MRITFGLRCVSFKQHSSYDALTAYLAESKHSLWIGEDAEVFASFWSAEIRHEFYTTEMRVGIILDQMHSVPRAAVSPHGDYLAIGYNHNVAFVDDVLLKAVEITLDSVFYCFFSNGNRVVAIHELGCDGFDTVTHSRCWQVATEIVVNVSYNGGALHVLTDDGKTCLVDLITGEAG